MSLETTISARRISWNEVVQAFGGQDDIVGDDGRAGGANDRRIGLVEVGDGCLFEDLDAPGKGDSSQTAGKERGLEGAAVLSRTPAT